MFNGRNMTLHGVIYHQGATNRSGHYTAGLKIGSNYFTLNDTLITKQMMLSSRSNDTIVPYLVIYRSQPHNCSSSNLQLSTSNETFQDFSEAVPSPDAVIHNGIENKRRKSGKTPTSDPICNIRRKNKFSLSPSKAQKDAAKQRMAKLRKNRDESQNKQIKEFDRKRKMNFRAELDETQTEKTKEADRKRKKNLRAECR